MMRTLRIIDTPETITADLTRQICSVRIVRCLITSACFAVLCAFALSIASFSFNTAQSRKGPQSTRRAVQPLQVNDPITEHYQKPRLRNDNPSCLIIAE